MLSRLRRFVVYKPKEGKWLGARVEVMSKRWFGSEIQPVSWLTGRRVTGRREQNVELTV